MKHTTVLGTLAVTGVLLASLPAEAAPVEVDKSIKGYTPAGDVSGNLNAIGSDTLNNLMTLWAEAFKKEYPRVKIQIEGKGSSTAPPALIAGTAQLGPMSRLMKPEEIDGFEKQYGYKPTPIRVAVDGLAVFVSKDNPLAELTMPQVDAIFSKTRKGGAPDDILTWGQLGLTGTWAAKPISLYGRNSASGTYGYFKEHALYKGDYKDTVKEQPGSAAVVQGITADKYAIGYSGIGYRTSDVKSLKLAAKDGGEYVTDDASNVYSGKYPLARFLYIYVNKAPGKSLGPLVREFLAFVLSKDGQEIVIKDGYLPLLGQHVAEELPKLK
jgi:phosphate transport system substrate-binding protein